MRAKINDKGIEQSHLSRLSEDLGRQNYSKLHSIQGSFETRRQKVYTLSKILESLHSVLCMAIAFLKIWVQA